MPTWQTFDEDQEKTRREELAQLPVYERAFYQPFETLVGIVFAFIIIAFVALRFVIRAI